MCSPSLRIGVLSSTGCSAFPLTRDSGVGCLCVGRVFAHEGQGPLWASSSALHTLSETGFLSVWNLFIRLDSKQAEECEWVPPWPGFALSFSSFLLSSFNAEMSQHVDQSSLKLTERSGGFCLPSARIRYVLPGLAELGSGARTQVYLSSRLALTS